MTEQALSPTYQALLLVAPHQALLLDAITEAGIAIEFCTPKGGFVASHAAAAQGVMDTEGVWLPSAKRDKIQALAAYFEGKIAAGRIIGPNIYEIDAEARADMKATWDNDAWPVTWPTMPDTVTGQINFTAPLSQAQFRAGALNILKYVNGLKARRAALNNAIRAAANYTALQAIDIAAGWPANP